jgi:hypothetical protein
LHRLDNHYVKRFLLQEEAEKLRGEVQRLTSELQELQLRSLSPEDAALLDPAVQHVVAQNDLMTSLARGQQLQVASAQSMLTECLVRLSSSF